MPLKIFDVIFTYCSVGTVGGEIHSVLPTFTLDRGGIMGPQRARPNTFECRTVLFCSTVLTNHSALFVNIFIGTVDKQSLL